MPQVASSDELCGALAVRRASSRELTHHVETEDGVGAGLERTKPERKAKGKK